ncbi:MAG: Ig-like domain-containing protein [Candidatus Dormiibacterota bacterium]
MSPRRRLSRLRVIPLGIAFLAPSVLLTGCFSAPPQIVQLNPLAGSTQLDANATVEVVFDQPVIHQSVATRLSVVESKDSRVGLTGCNLVAAFTARPGAPCWITWLTGESGFVLRHPGALFAPNTEYTFTLGAGVTSVNGNVNSLDHIWNLTSAAAPVLTSATPGGGASVARDTPLLLSFSRAMSASALAAAVSLSPAVTGLEVVRNRLDLGQFEVIPDRPLAPSTAYTLTVSRRATDAFGQPISSPITVHFRTTTLLAAGHLLVLAGPSLGDATTVMLAQLTAPATGLPIPAQVLDTVPVCTDPDACGEVGPGQPAAVIDSASLAPGGQWLAVVQTDVTRLNQPPVLRIIDVQNGLDQLDLTGATSPAWSPDGQTLAFVASNSTVQLYDPASGTLSQLPAGSPPSGPPVWTADGEALAIPVAATTTSPAHVDLANPSIGARYPLPGVIGSANHLVAAPQGEELAMQVTSSSSPIPATWVVDPAGSRPASRIGAPLTPVGFTDGATLVVALNAPPGSPQLGALDIGTGMVSPLGAGLGDPDPDSAGVAPSGRQIAYITTLAPGVEEAVIANADGSGPLPLTALPAGLEALTVSFGG